MIRFFVCAVVALLVLGCTPAAAPAPATPSDAALSIDKAAQAAARADVALSRAETAYMVIRGVADRVIPYLSPTRAAQVRALQAVADTAFAKARAASDLSVQAAELAKAAKAAAKLDSKVTDPD